MLPALAALRAALRRDHRPAESAALERLLPLQPAAQVSERIGREALALARRVRAAPPGSLGAESFLRQYGLSTPEGVALMCVAEALLRIPDAETQDALLREKLASGHWSSASAADWALLLTGTLMQWHDDPSALKSVLSRLGEPVARAAVRQAMRILAGQFVIAETAAKAAERAASLRPYRFSFDMLGEAARTAADAAKYLDSYLAVIRAAAAPDAVSIKLSALHPRFEEAKRTRILSELIPLLKNLGEAASRGGIVLTIDAEESERLELTLDLFESVAKDYPVGLAVQAYQKRALAVCDWLVALAEKIKKRLPIRLVKGAYWDGEIKRAQQLGMPGYPVFTRKAATDLSYMACAARLLAAPEVVSPAFATHNCRTVATILNLSRDIEFEFQKLFGMGDALYEAVLAEHPGVQVRVYAPVGRFTDLLPYLVRRLLENGANTSFVHQIADPGVALEELIADPAEALQRRARRVPRPPELYLDRKNSTGLDLSRRDVLDSLEKKLLADGPIAPVPTGDPIDSAISKADEAFESWSRTPAAERAAALERAADAMQASMADFVSLIVREGRRTYADAVSEVREAIDFCRYYALEARKRFGAPLVLPGPAGERNELRLHGRGVFACISPWNFPLSIFTGQVAAALAAGNAVVAKPAEQTPRIGAKAVELLRRSGVPPDVVHYVIGDGDIGAKLVADPRIAGVAFTGSTETAQHIQRALAARGGPIAPLIAETGGVNAMLADSSALPEQVVDDTIASAFNSAGQRCSAQRILFLDAEGAPRVRELLAGALAELKVGDPVETDTDVGPVIDLPSKEILLGHIDRLRRSARLIGETSLAKNLKGNYVAPIAFELSLEDLPRTEVFGPILHVCVYRKLEDVLACLRETGYGLTLGIHSRLQSFADRVVREARVGNIYINRNMIGAVVGVQPFGGEGLSGTGPKAGGPNYLLRFATERTLTVNTAAVGGVTDLLT
jgi:RHH-type proline utilization regulon transcriptional repressor/proline dehydrogenase/delta 1-pyrroline-5-carboxylate dehydrogenase